VTRKIFSVDAETDGLYGDVWAIGAVWLDGGTAAHFEGQLDPAAVTDPWVHKNVVPAVNLCRYDNRTDLLNAFWDFWTAHKDSSDDCIADFGVPVEAGLFRACVELDDIRTFEGPYPLDEVGTALRVAGFDRHADRRKLAGRPNLVEHNPVDDALVSALCWQKATTSRRFGQAIIRRWLTRRHCSHPRAFDRGWLIDTGMRKLFECQLCGRRKAV